MSVLRPGNTQDSQLDTLLGDSGKLIREARLKILRTVDTVQVQTCWQIGRHIVEFEQEGARRAAYGKRLLPTLAINLTTQFGKGFDERNLRYMRDFYQTFPIWSALRSELSWTHYRRPLRVENDRARHWYMNESARETNLEQALINQLQASLLEPGKGFGFIARQQRISTVSKDFYTELVFYNYLLKCFVIFDLKRAAIEERRLPRSMNKDYR